jgi:hypothetical protein
MVGVIFLESLSYRGFFLFSVFLPSSSYSSFSSSSSSSCQGLFLYFTLITASEIPGPSGCGLCAWLVTTPRKSTYTYKLRDICKYSLLLCSANSTYSTIHLKQLPISRNNILLRPTIKPTNSLHLLSMSINPTYVSAATESSSRVQGHMHFNIH